MKIKKRIQKLYKRRIMPWLQRAIGMDEITDNLYLFLNSATDITKCRQASGLLRTLQLADTELLKIIDLLCRENKICYWLDWGTLLGAVRHNGFIPWDDDLDICLPRSDYLRLYDVLRNFSDENKDFIIASRESVEKGLMWVNYLANGTHLDIYPIDFFDASVCSDNDQILKEIDTYWTSDVYCSDKQEIADPGQDNYVYFYHSNVWIKKRYFPGSIIFPLVEADFEGYRFYIPQNSEAYLTEIYGDYMSYPRNCVMKHKLLFESASKTENSKFLENYKQLQNIRQQLQDQNQNSE